MANWLGNPEHVYGDHPPTLEAGNLGSLVSSILSNRLGERALTQRTLSEAIKAAQERRQQAAYAQALQSTGLSEGQDLSGLSDVDSTRLAQLLQARTPDTQRDALLAAQTNAAQARADALNDPSTDDYSTTLDPAEQRRQDAEKRREEDARSKAIKAVLNASGLPDDAVPHALVPGETVKPGTYPFDVGGKRTDIPQGQVNDFNAAKRVYDALNKQRAQIPSQGGDRPSAYASPDQRKIALARQAMDDPQATPQEKEQARRILAGE